MEVIMFRRKPKVLTPEQMEETRTKDFFDMILPGSMKFFSDYYIMGDSYRSVWVIRGVSAIHRGTGNSFPACRPQRGNAPYLPQAGGINGAEEDFTECHQKKQADVRRK